MSQNDSVETIQNIESMQTVQPDLLANHDLNGNVQVPRDPEVESNQGSLPGDADIQVIHRF